MNEEILNEIWDMLMEECGATEHWRENFIHTHLMDDYRCTEFRFCGSLGFGGKFRSRDRWYVDCYQEDETPVRRSVIEKANKRLEELQKKHGS